MPRHIAQAKIDHYLSILTSDVLLGPEKKEALTKRLTAELDRLNHDLEQLQFAEDRAAKGRERSNVEAIQKLLDAFCDQLRATVTSRL